MSYPVSFSSVQFVLYRHCDKLIVYNKSGTPVLATHLLHVKSGGVLTPKYYHLSVTSGSLTIIEQVSAPTGTAWISQDYCTDFELDDVLYLHQIWTDDQSTQELIVGTGDTRDIVDSAWGFNLAVGVVISSPADDVFRVYYQHPGTLDRRTL